jgi:hypothetical protein
MKFCSDCYNFLLATTICSYGPSEYSTPDRNSLEYLWHQLLALPVSAESGDIRLLFYQPSVVRCS